MCEVLEIARIIAEWAERHAAVESVDFFGSVVRGDAHVESDLDILLKFDSSVDGISERGFFEEAEPPARDELRRLVAEVTSRSLSIHDKPDDKAFQYVEQGEVVDRIGKVCLVRTSIKHERHH